MSEKVLFEIEGLPVQQNRMYSTEEEALHCPRGDMSLVQNQDTGLVYNAKFDPALMIYDEHYQNEQGLSTAFQCHLEEVASIIDRHCTGMTIAELGCGKGWFMEMLQEKGYQVTGVDPAYEGESESVIKAYFTPELDLQVDALVLRHVLEHIQAPVEFLKSIANANGDQGLIYIEVPCFDWIIENNAWFDIFYEHVNYFRLEDFHRMFGTVLESGRLFGGQYLYVVADLATLRSCAGATGAPVELPIEFTSACAGLASEFADEKRVIWGGASKGVTFSLHMQRANLAIDGVIDINPAKQGKFLPVTGLRVSSPEEAMQWLKPGDNIVVMNPNYLEEIKKLTGYQFNYLEAGLCPSVTTP